MAQRGTLRRRPPAEWGLRALLATGVALAGCVGLSHSLAYSVRALDPERAHSLAPWDGQITALLSAKLSGPDASSAEREQSNTVARRALRQDATAVTAVATLGLNAQIRGDTASARRLFAYSKALSRRDLRSQIWAVQDAVARGDVAGALANYDIALRTSQVASDLMYPVLASAVAEPAIRMGLIRILTGRPPWAGSFTDYVANNDSNPSATASLFRGLRRAGVPISDGAQATVIGSLIAASAFDEAWAYYATIRPGVDRHQSRDPRFTIENASPSVFDWQPINDGRVSSSIQRNNGGGVFDFSVPPSVGGPLLNQTQMLPPGNYVLEGHSTDIDQPEGSRPYWLLSCRSGQELGRVVVPNSTQAGGVFAGRFAVPAVCSVQTLSFVARPSERVSGVAGQIDQVRLRPVS